MSDQTKEFIHLIVNIKRVNSWILKVKVEGKLLNFLKLMGMISSTPHYICFEYQIFPSKSPSKSNLLHKKGSLKWRQKVIY